MGYLFSACYLALCLYVQNFLAFLALPIDNQQPLQTAESEARNALAIASGRFERHSTLIFIDGMFSFGCGGSLC